MRPLSLRAALLVATLAAPAAHADMVIIQSGPMPSAAIPVMPQGSAFGMAEAFIHNTVVPRMQWVSADVIVQPGRPLAPPILLDDTDPDQPISFAGAWRLTEIVDDDGQPLDVDADLLSATEFNVDIDGPFSAYVGCNRMFGEIVMRGGVVASAEYGMTMMACLGPVEDLETAMTRVLDNASLVAMGNDMLVLLDRDGDKLAGFELVLEAP
ncbi:META domain-containing protein [Nioella nitratireducens]|uniref:META domain-containing protein n=1 Tax=Nioella nitratireducens TaxID=1287720 RepID=UPI0008FD4F4A|nr:META domain-containing protein [Nioella nitratireducens]